MSRQLEELLEERTATRHKKLIRAVEFELQGSISHVGGELHGVVITFRELEVFLTLKASFEGKNMVSFVSEEDLGSALLKCVRQAYQNSLRWKPDKYTKTGG